MRKGKAEQANCRNLRYEKKKAKPLKNKIRTTKIKRQRVSQQLKENKS